MNKEKKVLLAILDGWGHGVVRKADAIAQAKIPAINALYQQYPNGELITFGEDVGLPEGQMGNSEVGHTNIGAGRVVYQELARINKAVRDGALQKHPVLLKAMQKARDTNVRLHFMGLLSDGGVHSHYQHLLALCDMATEQKVPKTFIHAFTDGRDCDPKSGYGFLQETLDYIQHLPVEVATVIGRYYAMDRDKRWDRVKKAYDLLVTGAGELTENLLSGVEASYAKGVTDEFIPPLVNRGVDGRIRNGDVVVCFNFRTDRPREITEMLCQSDFEEQKTQALNLYFVSMTRYDATFKNVEVVFQKEDLTQTLGETLSRSGKTQVRIAETEKYPHVTFFLNGGREAPFEGERRIMIPSAKVATYDLQPEMSANEITAAIIEDMEQNGPDFICLNYANTDMVGHTGVFSAAMLAAETVSACTKRLLKVALQQGYEVILIADHGNSDMMINPDGSPNTAHSTNLVPIIYVSKKGKRKWLNNGRLADVAPTILGLMGLPQPSEMTGKNLITKRLKH